MSDIAIVLFAIRKNTMPKLTMMCAPPAAGKDTYISEYLPYFFRVSQDDQGKGYLQEFQYALKNGNDIVVSRMNFNKEQRNRYLAPAKEAGYTTEIIVLHQNYDTCFKRCMARIGHPTISTEQSARSALETFFTRYERPTSDEADVVTFVYPELKLQLPAVVFDLDGTLAEIDHRLHHVRVEKPLKKNWAAFNREIPNDSLNEWCKTLMDQMHIQHSVVICSGRNESTKTDTIDWLKKHAIKYDELFMRPLKDSRDDTIVKEIMLHFELKTRYNRILFVVDDRPKVVRMWRKNGLTVLACNEVEF